MDNTIDTWEDEFEAWLESDNVEKTSSGGYRTQCMLYKKEFSYEEVKEYYKKEYSN